MYIGNEISRDVKFMRTWLAHQLTDFYIFTLLPTPYKTCIVLLPTCFILQRNEAYLALNVSSLK